MVEAFKLKYGLFVVIPSLLLSCSLVPEKIEGTYYHEQMGDKYILTLSNDTFTQVFIKLNDTFTNSGQYSISDVVNLYSWKDKNDLWDATKGGC